MMDLAIWLVPVGLGMGVIGLLDFLWSMRSGQLDDLDCAAERVLHQADDVPWRDNRIVPLPHIEQGK